MQIVFAQGICRVAVPVFFFISGYLFYNGLKSWDWNVYRTKLKSRIYSLVIPYCIWNVVGWLLYCFKNYFVDGVSNIWTSYSFWEIIWSNSEGWPFVVPLWFVRDLIVVVVFAYFIFCVVRYLKFGGIILMCLLHIANIWIPLPGFSSVSILFFACGCYFQIFEKEPLIVPKPLAWISFIVFISMLLLIILCWNRVSINGYLHATLTIVGTILTFKLVSMIETIKHRKLYEMLAGASFFVFATHEIYILNISRIVINKLLPYDSQFIIVIRYFGYAILTYILCIFLYKLLNRLAPRLTMVLVGKR